MMTNHMTSAVSESRHAREEAEQLAAALRRARIEWEETLRERFSRRPYATIATAVGVGYVLGGGLVPGLLRPLAAAGGRVALGLLLQRVLAAPSGDPSPNTRIEEE
jgi:hypothetical protein